ncbi:gluconate:H+ symporter [Fructilactobacillus sanfranciscensis]|uniref:gluconate:H+ symporter n=1 Tax=Fructilactobacillus sanfranciscensis TaxID=1625 RepID=UPI0013D3D14E|nr:gluconate:H+ symporter [Fructilactobacillus sanfranciscensis]MCG7194787.1 gluconate permease [Fructilactobacillus sanfranciscensis]MDN4461898.1 gluconate permease [Fructilactobacillus sanfranciscensis]NDR61804.1 gluconate permease [Fructilactobacillus sanfranciscensis]
MPFVVLILGIALLLFLIIKLKLNTFVSLIVTAILVALGLGMNPASIADAIKLGIGNTLGELAIVFGFGAMIGRLVSDSGGSYRIAKTLIDKFGKKRLQLAIVIASFIIGMSLFFEVGLVLLTPIVFAVALEADVPFLYLGIPMAAALSATQGFLPPQPAPTAVATALGANIGQVLLFGIIVAIPCVIVAGPVYTKISRKFFPDAFVVKKSLPAFGEVKQYNLKDTPNFALAAFTSLLPAIFMALNTIYQLAVHGGKEIAKPHGFDAVISMLGNPMIAMVIALLFAIWSMGFHRGKSMKDISLSISDAVKSIAMLLLVIAGGGAFKQVLIAGGVGNAVKTMMMHSSLSPIILGWLVAVILRVSLGSATVAGMTAAGLVIPLMSSLNVSPVMMALAIGAGSLAASHVNDAGFWMFKEYFDLSVKETLGIWTVLETVISVTGLIVVLILNMFV